MGGKQVLRWSQARCAAVSLLLLALLAACGPEAGRGRGGGAGADTGNHARREIPASKVWSSDDP